MRKPNFQLFLETIEGIKLKWLFSTALVCSTVANIEIVVFNTKISMVANKFALNGKSIKTLHREAP